MITLTLTTPAFIVLAVFAAALLVFAGLGVWLLAAISASLDELNAMPPPPVYQPARHPASVVPLHPGREPKFLRRGHNDSG